MATYTVNTAKHATLTAYVVDVVTLLRTSYQVEVLNRGASDIYFTVDGAIPVVGGDDCCIVVPGGALSTNDNDGVAVVRLVSAAATAYSVTGAKTHD